MNAQERIAIEYACMRLCVDFARFVDQRRYDEFISLFAENGSFARAGTLFEGHSGLRRFLDNRPTDIVTRHLCSNFGLDTVADDRATGSCQALMFQSSGSTGAPPLPLAAASPKVVEYSDVYVCTSSGWRLLSRMAQVVFSAP